MRGGKGVTGVIEIHDNHVENCHNKTHYYKRDI